MTNDIDVFEGEANILFRDIQTIEAHLERTAKAFEAHLERLERTAKAREAKALDANSVPQTAALLRARIADGHMLVSRLRCEPAKNDTKGSSK